eukprot:7755234-Pyramimonas_sp.AAC.4
MLPPKGNQIGNPAPPQGNQTGNPAPPQGNQTGNPANRIRCGTDEPTQGCGTLGITSCPSRTRQTAPIVANSFSQPPERSHIGAVVLHRPGLSRK